MTFNKYYASSVEEARKKARNELGQTYIVMEAQEAANGKPAWIHVLNESTDISRDKNNALTYSRRDLFPKVLTKLKETLHDGIQLFNVDQKQLPDASYESGTEAADPATYNRKQFQKISTKKASANETNFPLTLEKEFESAKQLEKLTGRFDRLEKLISEQFYGSKMQYIPHPAFQQLLTSGVPQPIITNWFNELLNEGLDPYRHESGFVQRLGEKVKQALDVAADTQPARYLLFTGLSGAGKSHLLMKLALHASFFGKDSCALVSVQPFLENVYSPLSAFASEQNIEHFTVKSTRQLEKLKNQFSHFNRILIEMPGLDIQNKAMAVKDTHIRNILGNEASIEVHRVINASLNEKYLSNELFADYPAAEYLDFTHLDRTPQKGRLLPLMQKSHCSVRYISSGPQIPNHISRYDPVHFARYLLSNS